MDTLNIEITFDPELLSDTPYIAYCVELDATGLGATIPDALADLAMDMPRRALDVTAALLR